MRSRASAILAGLPRAEVQVSSIEAGHGRGARRSPSGRHTGQRERQPLRSTTTLHEIENDTDGKPLDVVYSRAGVEHHVTITPEKRDLDGLGEHWVIGLKLEPRNRSSPSCRCARRSSNRCIRTAKAPR